MLKLKDLQPGDIFKLVSTDTGRTNINTVTIYQRGYGEFIAVAHPGTGKRYPELQYLYYNVKIVPMPKFTA